MKQKILYIIIVALVVGSGLSIFSILSSNPNSTKSMQSIVTGISNGEGIASLQTHGVNTSQPIPPSGARDDFIPYAMRSHFLIGNFEFDEVLPKGASNVIFMSIFSNKTLHNCSLTYNNKISNTTLLHPDISSGEGIVIPVLLNETILPLNTTNTMSFYCADSQPPSLLSWPNLELDKTEYVQGDILYMKGKTTPSSNIEVIVSHGILWRFSSDNIDNDKNITSQSDGNFVYSYTIPHDDRIGKYFVNIREGNEEYAIGFKVI